MPEFEVQYLRVFVRDFDRALRFYTGTLGLTATEAYEGWAQFDTGACQRAIERVDPEDDEAVVESLPGLGQSLVGRFVGASLRVTDIDATYCDLLAKASSSSSHRSACNGVACLRTSKTRTATSSRCWATSAAPGPRRPSTT
jgi:hypothetical protein